VIKWHRDIWEIFADIILEEAICIPTNGYVKSNGQAVMGRGVAKQATRRIPGIQKILGKAIVQNGNIVQVVYPGVIAFPTKPAFGVCALDKSNVVSHWRDNAKSGQGVPGWAMLSDLALISASLDQLEELQQEKGWGRVYLPRPGCGAGGLDWEKQVRPLCEQTGDWLIVVTRPSRDVLL